VEVLLRCDLTRAELVVVEIYDVSSTVGVVRWERLSRSRKQIRGLINQKHERLRKRLTEVRIFVLSGLPGVQLQLLDATAGSGLGTGMAIAFAANSIFPSADVVGFTPDPFERFITTDRPVGLGVDLPAVGVARDAISSNACGVYGEVAGDSWNY